MKLFIQVGPGNHDKILFEVLKQKQISFSYSYYWPKFEIGKIDTSGRKEITDGSKLYDKVSYFLWGIWHRIPFIKRKQEHLNFLYPLYDSIVSNYTKDIRILIAWSQVGLHTIRCVKKQGGIAILEHPMIHVNAWMKLMVEEYKLYGNNLEVQYSLFTKKIINRMLQEYEEADYINVISSFAKQTFIDNGVKEEKIIVTPLAIDTSIFKPLPKPVQKSYLKVIYVGRLELLKGVHYLLKAFAELNLENVELLLVGRILPEIKPFLEKYKGYYTYLGTKTPQELVKLYQEADLLVLPSIQEAFGLVILEAMATGVPVIATKNTGGPDVIVNGKNGFIIPIRSADAIKEKILWAYNNPSDLQKMKINTRKSISNRFDFKNYADKMEELFKVVNKTNI